MKYRKVLKNITASILLTVLLLGAGQAMAQCPEEGDSSGGSSFLFFKGPLVPCGVKDYCGNPEPCTLCHLLKMVDNVFRLMLSLLITASLVMITVGGVLYIVSAGNSGLQGTAKGIITKTLTGFGLFLLSWLIVYTVLLFVSAKTGMLGSGGKWYEFDCNTYSRFGDVTVPLVGPPEKGEDITEKEKREQEVRARLAAAGIKVVGNTEVGGLKEETIQRLIAMTKYGEVVVTGGSEPGHASGTYSHANGYKVDLRLTSSITSHIQNNYQYLGTRSDGAKVYSDGKGNYYAKEGDHWDISFNTPPPNVK